MKRRINKTSLNKHDYQKFNVINAILSKVIKNFYLPDLELRFEQLSNLMKSVKEYNKYFLEHLLSR